MLIQGSRLIRIPILSLQTGTKLALTKKPIIDPGNLKILAYEIDGEMLSQKPSFIMINDVRELSDIGMIVDSSDEFIGINDVIVIRKIRNLNFNIVGMTVINENHKKLGKVIDYSLDTDSFIIQQLNVAPGMLKSLSKTDFLINRTQIIEINDHAIIVKSTNKKVALPILKNKQMTYANPFRSTT
jgi:uncharacterized protein YrrD